MNLKFRLNNLRRRTLLVVAVIVLSATMLPTAAFASSYGNQGRGWDPGARQSRGYQRPAHNNDDRHKDDYNYNKKDDYNKKDNNYNKNDDHKNNRHNDDKHHNRCDASYRVKRGDTLTGIAKHFGLSIDKLAKANGIRNPNRIFVGQVLCIP